MKTMELWREGTFEVKGATETSNRCGIGTGLVFRYSVRLSAENLNSRGFILDNRVTNLYWCAKWGTDTPKTLVSCEELAEIACNDFVKLCMLEEVKLLGCEIHVYGGDYSCVTVRWGQITPSHPHPAFGTVEPQPGLHGEEIEPNDPVLANLQKILAAS